MIASAIFLMQRNDAMMNRVLGPLPALSPPKRGDERMSSQHFEFTLIVGDVPNLPDALVDALYEAGCDDALVCHGDSELEIEFARETETLDAAVRSAIANVESTGLKVQRVETAEYKYPHGLNQELD